MLRIFLPPNLATAAPRDAIALKMEADLTREPQPQLVPALAMLSLWAGPGAAAAGSNANGPGSPSASENGRPPHAPRAFGTSQTSPQQPFRAFLQVNRWQLRELVASLAGQPVFAWINEPGKTLGWTGARLAGVSEWLDAPPALPSAAATLEVPARREGDRPGARSRSDGEPLTVDGSEHFLSIGLPSREHPNYTAALDLLKSSGFTLEPSNRRWWLRDRHKTLSFLATHGTRLRETFVARFTPGFLSRTAHLKSAEVVCEVTTAADGFDVTVGIDSAGAGDAALREAIATGRGYVESGKEIILIDPVKLARVAAAQRALGGNPAGSPGNRRSHRITAPAAAEAEELLEELSPGFQPPEAWRAKTEGLRNLSRLEPAPVGPALDSAMRPYQRLGAAWLWHLHRNALGGVLADEMGLGKTLQALALLTAVKSAGGSSGSLVVCPASLVENWRREQRRFAPGLRTFVHHGSQRLESLQQFGGHDLVVTSYGTLARDRELFASVEFACVIGDEAQHAKNRASQNAQVLRSLRAKGRFLLTGTPLENSLDDLRSLFDIILPGYLGRLPSGLRGDERAWHDERLRARTAPYILRRTKREVAPELPEKIEQVLWCEFAPAQAALYREMRERSERELIDLEAGGAGEGRLRLAALTQLLRLRQVCCDPRLVAQKGGPDEEPYSGSTKLDTFREIVSEAIDDGHRVLVFSQFTSLLALLRTDLDARQTAYCYLDGTMSTRARQAEVDRFQEDTSVPLFLLSLKAGGTGLNLTGADTVIHFDPWWNPAVEAQATDRAHRIGQTRVVTSYKLICSGTVEEEVMALQDSKRALLADVFEASDAAAARLSLADLKSLLRS